MFNDTGDGPPFRARTMIALRRGDPLNGGTQAFARLIERGKHVRQCRMHVR
jgi:hypothetical protein